MVNTSTRMLLTAAVAAYLASAPLANAAPLGKHHAHHHHKHPRAEPPTHVGGASGRPRLPVSISAFPENPTHTFVGKHHSVHHGGTFSLHKTIPTMTPEKRQFPGGGFGGPHGMGGPPHGPPHGRPPFGMGKGGPGGKPKGGPGGAPGAPSGPPSTASGAPSPPTGGSMGTGASGGSSDPSTSDPSSSDPSSSDPSTSDPSASGSPSSSDPSSDPSSSGSTSDPSESSDSSSGEGSSSDSSSGDDSSSAAARRALPEKTHPTPRPGSGVPSAKPKSRGGLSLPTDLPDIPISVPEPESEGTDTATDSAAPTGVAPVGRRWATVLDELD